MRAPTKRVTNADAGAAEAFTLSADYGGADHGARRREHAVGTSQLTELAASGSQAARAAFFRHRPTFAKRFGRSAVALAQAEIGGDRRECLGRTRVPHVVDTRGCPLPPAAGSDRE
jgi:hypothetical protein